LILKIFPNSSLGFKNLFMNMPSIYHITLTAESVVKSPTFPFISTP
jgi:hypothetical protein